MFIMRTQSVVIGEIVIDDRSVTLRAEVPASTSREWVALLKYKLAYLLDTRFRPATSPRERLSLEEVAERLHCRCRTVLRMIRRGDLHPVTGDDGELYFDPVEVDIITRVPLGDIVTRLIPRH